MNATTGFYDLPFRNYDATLGRFFQVDPLAHMDASTSPFVYGGNNPVAFNDPSGALMSTGEVGRYNMPGSGGFHNSGDDAYWSEWHNDFVAASDARNEAYTGGATGSGGNYNWILEIGNLIINSWELPENSLTTVFFQNGLVSSYGQGNKELGSLIIAFMTTPKHFSQTGWGGVGQAKDLGDALKIVGAFTRDGTKLKNLILFSHGTPNGDQLHFGDSNLTIDDYQLNDKNELVQSYNRALFNGVLEHVQEGGNVILIGCNAGADDTGIANYMQRDIRRDINLYVNRYLSGGREDRDPVTGKLNWEKFHMDSEELGHSQWWNVQTGQKGITLIVNSNGTVTFK